MSDLTIERNDFGFYVQGTLNNADGSPFNLTGYSLSVNCWELGNWKHPIISAATAEIVSATEGKWRYPVVVNDFPKDGDFKFNVRATKTGAQETSKNYTVKVEENP